MRAVVAAVIESAASVGSRPTRPTPALTLSMVLTAG